MLAKVIFLKPSERGPDDYSMTLEQVINRVTGRMQPATAISTLTHPPTIIKIVGMLDPIRLDVVMRASQNNRDDLMNVRTKRRNSRRPFKNSDLIGLR